MILYQNVEIIMKEQPFDPKLPSPTIHSLVRLREQWLHCETIAKRCSLPTMAALFACPT